MSVSSFVKTEVAYALHKQKNFYTVGQGRFHYCDFLAEQVDDGDLLTDALKTGEKTLTTTIELVSEFSPSNSFTAESDQWAFHFHFPLSHLYSHIVYEPE